MKRVLIFCVVVGLFAGQASAVLYTLDVPTAQLLRGLSYSDPAGTLDYVGLDDGTKIGTYVWGTSTQYGEYFQNIVGFTGQLKEDLTGADVPNDNLSSAKIGAFGTPALALIQNGLSYTGFYLPLANDNDDPWEFQAYVIANNLTYTSGAFVQVPAGTSTGLTVDFGPGGPINFNNVTDLGFVVQGNWNLSPAPSNPDFYHVSIVPVPAAVVLGILGLGVVGLKLRKYA